MMIWLNCVCARESHDEYLMRIFDRHSANTSTHLKREKRRSQSLFDKLVTVKTVTWLPFWRWNIFSMKNLSFFFVLKAKPYRDWGRKVTRDTQANSTMNENVYGCPLTKRSFSMFSDSDSDLFHPRIIIILLLLLLFWFAFDHWLRCCCCCFAALINVLEIPNKKF